MRNRKSSAKQKNMRNVPDGWEWAIGQVKSKIKRLEVAAKVFEERKAAGEPWPGSTSLEKSLSDRA